MRVTSSPLLLARPGGRGAAPGAARGKGDRGTGRAGRGSPSPSPPTSGRQVCRGGSGGEASPRPAGRAALPASPCADPPSPLILRWRSIVSRHNKPREERWSRQSSNVLTGGRKTSTDTLQLFGDGGLGDAGGGEVGSQQQTLIATFALLMSSHRFVPRSVPPPVPSPPPPGGALVGRGMASGESRNFSAIRYSVLNPSHP